jgi:hypothetical protein
MHYRYRRIKNVVSVVEETTVDTKEDPKVDMGAVVATNMTKEEVEPPHVLIVVRMVSSHNFVPSYACFMPIFIFMSM